MYIAEKNNICDYSCITARLLPPAYCHNAIITARHNNARVIPAARPITNVFYFECIIHLDTRSFPRNSIISNNNVLESFERKNIPFYFFPSPEGCAIPNACNPHVSDYIRAHSTARKREREKENSRSFLLRTHSYYTDTS